MASDPDSGFLRIGSLDEVRRKGVVVLPGADPPIAVFASGPGDAPVRAVDNRCPHMGFPLHRGTVQDGVLTCHWHHARFDLCSGCAFDLFADDVPAYDVEIRDGVVWVAPMPRGDRSPAAEAERGGRRLREGMEQNLSLIQARAILRLLKAGVPPREVACQVAGFGTRFRDGWASGLTSLTALARLAPLVEEETAYLALYQGARRVAADCAGMPPRRERQPLETEGAGGTHPLETLQRWLREWTLVRHRDGAERTLLTAVHQGASPAGLADLFFSAATERFYADTGHLVDFGNKAFELLDLVGWELAAEVLPALVAQLAAARGGEEMNAWRSPIDLVGPLRELERELPALLAAGEVRGCPPEEELPAVRALAEQLLGEDPLANLAALRNALAEGLAPEAAGRALAYAAAMRVARFGSANELGDWITALHTFSYCSAIHQAVRRSPTPGVVRGLFHGAASIYLDRFLNVPPAPLPGERGSLDDESRDGPDLLARFLSALDQRQALEAAPRAVARYLELRHPLPPLRDALVLTAVREDADFHTFQMVEAGLRQRDCWEGEPEGDRILVAVARYLAAHSPTQRAQLQTAKIALRLHRGDEVFNEQ